MLRSLVVTTFALTFANLSHAQSSSASVAGRVTDPTGAVIPGVVLKVTNLDTNQARQVESNGVGDYTIPFLPPGRYSVEALS